MTFRRFITAAVAASVLGLTVIASPAATRAADDELRVINGGTHVISEIYATSTVSHMLFGDKSWGRNILGANISPGYETSFTKGPKPATAAGCKQDMQFVYTDGYVRTVKEIDICRVRSLKLTY